MSSILLCTFGFYRAADGVGIVEAVAEAIAYAAYKKRRFTFEHSAVYVVAEFDSDPALLCRDWQRGVDGCLGEGVVTVGPYPAAELSAEEHTRDNAIRDTKAKLRLLQQAAERTHKAL